MASLQQKKILSGKDSYILGISFGFHDSAVALIQKGKVLNAVEEERFTGVKHDNSFPMNSISWILKENNITKKDISVVCYYENPILKKDRIVRTARKTFFKNPISNFKLLFTKEYDISKLFREFLIAFTAAASAFFSSPLPICKELAKEAISVTRTASKAKFLSRYTDSIYYIKNDEYTNIEMDKEIVGRLRKI